MNMSKINTCPSLLLVIFTMLFTSTLAAQNILFVRGADRSGGFLEGDNDFERTEHLADIFNEQTDNNHGWGELRLALENAGFNPTQITETAENDSGPSEGIAIEFQDMDLSQYDVIVFGSNNAVYSDEAIDAVENFIRGGGGALFISDANFGGDWADAPNSDQQFLDRFDLVMNQDNDTYILRRSDGDFNAPDHPILAGVDAFDGEGVSPIVAMNESDVLVGAQGQTRVNTPPFDGNNQGQLRPVTALDGVLTVLEPGVGRLAGHFDRNTFFNDGGVGSDITRFDNETYAINLFTWLSDTDPDVQFRDGFEESP